MQSNLNSEVPAKAVLIEGNKETAIYPLGVSIDKELMLSERESSMSHKGAWLTAHLVSRNTAIRLIEMRGDCAIFQL